MARSRNIKPAFFKNEYLAKLSFPARLLFIALWTLADCEGRLEDRPQRVKAEAFPYDDLDVDCLLGELASSPEQFIVRYVVDGKAFIQIANFLKHQNPHKREKEAGSQIPPCPVQGRDVAGPKPGLAPDWHSTCPADSLLLIPDSLTPETRPDASASVCVNEENQILAEEGFRYLASLNHPNFGNISWVKGFLGIRLGQLEQERPNLIKPDILTCWQAACDLAVHKNISAPKWLKSTFENQIRDFVPAESKAPAHGSTSSQARDALLSFPFIRHTLTGEVFPVEQMETRPESPATLYFKGNSFPVAMLEGLQEMPA